MLEFERLHQLIHKFGRPFLPDLLDVGVGGDDFRFVRNLPCL